MKQSILAAVALAGLAAAERQCSILQAFEEGGNFFCGQVEQIVYNNFKTHGKFKDVTFMGPSGECETADREFDSPFGALGEGVSIHGRGPLKLRNFAAYHLEGSHKRDDAAQASSHVHARRHGHQHFHNERKKKREEWVTATIDGQVQSWINNWHGEAAATEAPAPPAAPPAAHAPPAAPAPVKANEGVTQNAVAAHDSKHQPKPDSKPPKPSRPSGPAGSWTRTSFYDAKNQVSDNIVFLGNYGGAGSGVFDNVWGNSLSYLNAEGNGGSGSPQTLKDIYIPSNKEFTMYTGEKCDESCGFSRAQDVAYKGFSTRNSVFLFEFMMPMDGTQGFNADMPAVWMLNERIPRTMQYGACSCWPACGEIDFYEVLATGDKKCKSTIHLEPGAGSSDYFERPTDKYIKAAIIFHEASGKISMKRVPDDVEFGTSIDDATVRSWVDVDTKNKGSIFSF
jgi:hypothetical protein